jgi:deferrochelatase/peroxidase EfeB
MGSTPVIDPTDVQGVVRFGFGALTEACYLLVRIRDAAAARAWCAIAPVATAELLPQLPEVALQVGFTYSGLRELGLPSAVLAGFSAEFRSGMAGEENRSRRLGDVGPSAPDNWFWGSSTSTVDAVIMLFAKPGKLAAFRNTVEDAGWQRAFQLLHCLPTSDLKGHEQFGFTDGVSQPKIDWDAEMTVNSDEITYRNLIAAGEFLLGYPNEYGKYTDRPFLDSSNPRATDLLPAEDSPDKKDIGRNGTYVVMRTLEQDVRGFWKFLDGQTHSDPAARQKLGETMVGRTIDGHPLVPLSPVPIEGVSSTDDKNLFTFGQDGEEAKCPFGAHIRRANPRNTDFPNRPSWFLTRVWSMLGFASKGIRSDIMASARFHRILRRGREYGAGLTPEMAVEDEPADNEKRGLHFLCLNANITRQFEFVQNAWLMSTKFDGLSGESDPLLGNRTPVGDGRSTDSFTIPQSEGVRHCVAGLPQFITVQGGAYFFLPGIRALRYFSRAAE